LLIIKAPEVFMFNHIFPGCSPFTAALEFCAAKRAQR
jgi:hypothetical protein